MKRLVVGTDGSPAAADALRWSAHLAACHGAEVVVMTGFIPIEAERSPRRAAALLEERRALTQSWIEEAQLVDVSIRPVVEPGDPRRGILAVAGREEADLVVVGRVGYSAGPGLLHIGSMAEWLAHHADRPIAVIGGVAAPMIRSALVGVDGSPGSRAALRWVRDLASVSDVRIVVATVEQPSLDPRSANGAPTWRAELERRIRTKLAADLVTAGVGFHPLALRNATAADALILAAEREQADVIVVGARGLGGFSELRIGGVAMKTLHRADRPVVIVPSR